MNDEIGVLLCIFYIFVKPCCFRTNLVHYIQCSWSVGNTVKQSKLDSFFFLLFIMGYSIWTLYTPVKVEVHTGGGTRMAKGGIRLIHGHTKSTLIMHFSGMKIDPKYAFLHAFFLTCPSCPSQNLSIWPKTHSFSNFARFCTPKRCTHVQCLVWKTTLITWIFGRAWYPPWHSSAPPPGVHIFHTGEYSFKMN